MYNNNQNCPVCSRFRALNWNRWRRNVNKSSILLFPKGRVHSTASLHILAEDWPLKGWWSCHAMLSKDSKPYYYALLEIPWNLTFSTYITSKSSLFNPLNRIGGIRLFWDTFYTTSWLVFHSSHRCIPESWQVELVGRRTEEPQLSCQRR